MLHSVACGEPALSICLRTREGSVAADAGSANRDGTKHVARCMAAARCMLRDAGSFCYRRRNGLDVMQLLSHGGLECIAVVVDSHMFHHCALNLLFSLFADCCNATRGRQGAPEHEPDVGLPWS